MPAPPCRPPDVVTRRRRLRDWLDRHGDQLDPDHEPPSMFELAPWLLVQRNVWGHQYRASTHATPAQAAVAYQAQQYPEDWRIVELLNLDTGRRLTAVDAIRWRVA